MVILMFTLVSLSFSDLLRFLIPHIGTCPFNVDVGYRSKLPFQFILEWNRLCLTHFTVSSNWSCYILLAALLQESLIKEKQSFQIPLGATFIGLARSTRDGRGCCNRSLVSD